MPNTPLDGYKTYILVALGLAVCATLYVRGDLAGSDFLQNALMLLGFAGLRDGVDKGASF